MNKGSTGSWVVRDFQEIFETSYDFLYKRGDRIMNVTLIKTRKDYGAALNQISSLMSADPNTP